VQPPAASSALVQPLAASVLMARAPDLRSGLCLGRCPGRRPLLPPARGPHRSTCRTSKPNTPRTLRCRSGAGALASPSARRRRPRARANAGRCGCDRSCFSSLSCSTVNQSSCPTYFPNLGLGRASCATAIASRLIARRTGAELRSAASVSGISAAEGGAFISNSLPLPAARYSQHHRRCHPGVTLGTIAAASGAPGATLRP
jgi:hypothetical protein